MRLVVIRPLIVILLATVLGGCGGGDDVPTVLAASIEVAAGDHQSGSANARLAEPLVARIRDEAGAVIGRVSVDWSISPAGGLSPSASMSDVDGEARVDVMLGPVGTYSIIGHVRGTSLAQQFTAIATDPPTLTALAPSTFRAADTVVASGTNLDGAPEITVGGTVGPIVTATATAITFVAPSCLAGGPQPVTARIGTATTNALTATYQASAEPLALVVGQYVSIDPAVAGGCAQFASPTAAEEYLLIPQATAKVPGVTSTFRVGGSAVPLGQATVAAAPPLQPTFAQRFHDRIRALEREYLGDAGVPLRYEDQQVLTQRLSAAALPVVGSSRTFHVCGSLDHCDPFQTVTATVHYVGSRIAIYLDDDVPPGGLTERGIGALGAEFDTRLYPVDSRAFGSEPDIDANGVVIVLMTDAVNRLTPRAQCNNSFIAGFFFGLDLLPTQPNSNAGEIFYSFVADPNGTVSCTHSIARVNRVTPSTFVHELQHMISWNQRVTLRGSTQGEEIWLDEGLSHFAEELGGRSYLADADTATFSAFLESDLVFAFRYFKAPTSFFLLVPDVDAATSEYRGASWSFVRWLVDQFGADVTRRLVETNLTGGSNVEAATGQPFSRLLAEWGLAWWVEDLPGFQPPARLRYTSWDFRTTYAALNQISPLTFDRPFPIEPLIESDGRMLVRTGTLRAGSPDYLLLRLDPGAAPFAVSFTDGGGLPLANTLVPRLTVLRIQ